jgi:iron complex transport system substrate-binding protein
MRVSGSLRRVLITAVGLLTLNSTAALASNGTVGLASNGTVAKAAGPTKASEPGTASPGVDAPDTGRAPAPQRVITLLPSLTETVCALGACDRLVGIDRYSNHPARVLSLPRLGGLEDPRIEALVALRPDLVIAPLSWRGIESMKRVGLTVLAVEPSTLEQTRASMVQIAVALGLGAERGHEAWQAMEGQWRAAAVRIPLRWREGSVYVEVSTAPHAASAGSFVGEVLQRIGLKSAIAADLGPFPRLNPEAVLKADPTWIVASREGLASMRQRPALRELRALREGRACGFETREFDLLVRPGPRLGEGALLLAQCLAQKP